MATTAGRFPHAEIKRRRRAFVRKHRWRLAVVAGVSTAVVLALAMFFPTWVVPAWGVVLFVILAAAMVAREQIDGTYYLVAARDSERWTSKDLGRMLGRGWHIVDGIHFWHGDADHIVVGPGGVFVVETKSTDSPFDPKVRSSREKAEGWAEDAHRRARSTRLLLRRHGVEVIPVIVMWGGEVTGTPWSCDGVRVLHRSDLREEVDAWKQRERVLGSVQLEEMKRDLLSFVSSQQSRASAER